MPPETPPSPATPPPLARTRTRLALAEFTRRRDALVTFAQKNPVRSSVVVVGLIVFLVAGWPLATRGWDAFWSLPHAGRLTLCAVALIAIVWAILYEAPLRLREWVEKARLASVIGVAWAVAIGLVTLIVAGTWWVMGAPTPLPPDQLPPRALDSIATRAFAVVAGLGGVALLVIHYRRQRTTEADAERAERAAQREVTKLFNERFTSAYTELGSEHAAVRLGAVHALAHLADDAPSEEEVQMVIDVLCAYLRMPYDYAPELIPKNASRERREEHRKCELEFAALREVRHTIIRVIGNHLRGDTRWLGKDYDFTGVVFDGGDLYGARFTGGWVSFHEAEFTGGMVSFLGADFAKGTVDFSFARFTGGMVSFLGARFTGGTVNFSLAEFAGGEVNFRGGQFFSGREVIFNGAEFTSGSVHFQDASGECPIKLLESVASGGPGVVVLPEAWQPNSTENVQETSAGAPADAGDH